MKNTLWRFIDDKGSFVSDNAQHIHTLYLPLCNTHPFMSSVTPGLHGDAKTGNNTFLLEPVSRIDLNNSKISRNFWIYLNPDKVWSATGVSKDLSAIKNDRVSLKAGLLWQEITRQNRNIGLESKITSFVPASGEPVELMLVTITNTSGLDLKFIPTAAIPIYARSANNLRDHRHVTSLLNRLEVERFGVTVTPTLLFDETGHKKNETTYFVFGFDENRDTPAYIYPTQEEFCGEGGDLETPEAIYRNLLPDVNKKIQGKETIGALRFGEKKLKHHESVTFTIVLGIAPTKQQVKNIFNKFNNLDKIRKSLVATKNHWQNKSDEIKVDTKNSAFDNWFRWVSIQPTLRKIFGCSFLPDFDYGKGGRGWRDLWQDCLSLILNSPEDAKQLLINNFSGVRIDGSNATIIGQNRREFIADRNNISRVWMDHGAWPLVTTHLYIHQTGDLKILLQKTGYFRDRQLSRSKIYLGTILEHILLENLVQFFNVGSHNIIRLQGADWNDGLDMAQENGESVAFSCLYAKNLNDICELLVKLGQKEIVIFKELAILLDTLAKKPIDYSSTADKQKLLEKYFNTVNTAFSGQTITISRKRLIMDLKEKSEWLTAHIRKNEWLKDGFYNGYYDNNKERLEGNCGGIMRMTLTGQTFPILGGIATTDQIESIFDKSCAYLKDQRFGGFHLNTDFKKMMPALGRAFSFVYGDKENGAFFNHMAVMFSYSLYSRGFAKEGFEVLNSISQMALDTQNSKIYPCLPEYFNADGRGMYSYLTGSASWYILTLLTQAFGVRGEYGDLVLEPKLISEQFNTTKELSINAVFANKQIKVIYSNPFQKDFGKYTIKRISLNDRLIASDVISCRYCIPRKKFLSLTTKNINLIEILLG
ncbi:MAG: cellobiose phosphorylase [Candidatus Omnitrophica bacterium]|nr:cellobiose phosphorylase [Candidatus Omnitrophota bacterium]